MAARREKEGSNHTMPIIQVEILPRPIEMKRELAQKLTETTCDILNCPTDAVRVIIREMKPENYATAGVLQIDK